jgi:uncharacterized membrane protein
MEAGSDVQSERSNVCCRMRVAVAAAVVAAVAAVAAAVVVDVAECHDLCAYTERIFGFSLRMLVGSRRRGAMAC